MILILYKKFFFIKRNPYKIYLSIIKLLSFLGLDGYSLNIQTEENKIKKESTSILSRSVFIRNEKEFRITEAS